MAQVGFTPIKLYASGTALAQPLAADLAFGELALNYNDGKIYYKNASSAVVAISGGVTTISFGTTGLTPNTATAGVVSVAGTLVSGNGGTGFSTYAAGDFVYASAINTLAKLPIGTNGFVLTVVAGLPAWAASTGGVTTFSGGTTGLTPNTATAGAITLAGILAVANGGTGTATPSIVAGTNVIVSGTWPNQTINSVASGTGDVVGPASATDNAITRFDLTTGKLIQNSLVTVADDGAITAPQVGSVIPFYYANQAAFPSAASYHGALAHSHADGAMFFAHGGVWVRIIDNGGPLGTPSSGTATNLTGLPLTTGVTGTLSVANGGTSLATLTANNVIIGNGTSAPLFVAPSTNGNVLTSNGTTWTSATPAGGLTGFTAALNVVAPNATNNVSSLTASGGSANQFLAIAPKGTGGILGAIPDSTITGGNSRGASALDLQLSRATAAQVASGINSIIVGGVSNTASTTHATVIGGDLNTSSGLYALAHGTNNLANAEQSMAVGAWASTRSVVGYKAFAPNAPIASALGNTQMGFVTVGVQTTDATPTILRSNTSVAASTNQYYVPLSGIATFTILISCGITGASNAKAWEFKGAAKKGSTENTNVLVGALTKNVLAADAGASTWDVAVTANTVTGAITITAIGQAATTIRWSATIIANEVSY